MEIRAFKMDGLGNDFVIIDNRKKITDLTKDQIIKICDRNFIGCDQLIIIQKNQKTDASLIFYNSDGSISGACGNGTRCIAEFISKENNKETIVLTTSSGNLSSKILGNFPYNSHASKKGFQSINSDIFLILIFCWKLIFFSLGIGGT